MAYTMQEVLNDEESTLRLYFDDIAESKPLSREREVELAAQIQDGDMAARDELVQANLRFVIDVAKNYQNRGLSLSDLISAGNVGLLTAAERFDGTKGYKFISYAVWWIKQSILQTIAENARTVRLPLNKLSLLKDISKASRRLGQGREGDPAIEEIAAELDVPAEEVLDTMMSARTVRSLDEAFEEDDERSLINILADGNQETPDADVLRNSAREQLEEVP
ncbi:MAG: RNA polymerase sigma factor RpoD/SigA, partial [Gemmatimonadetes bacterium]|nr:RNA polymerase sigma factor RpoD/SigA [Gemmatimonadota bacterium]